MCQCPNHWVKCTLAPANSIQLSKHKIIYFYSNLENFFHDCMFASLFLNLNFNTVHLKTFHLDNSQSCCKASLTQASWWAFVCLRSDSNKWKQQNMVLRRQLLLLKPQSDHQRFNRLSGNLSVVVICWYRRLLRNILFL